MSEKKTICFAASTGGHFEQLLMLESLMRENNSFIITEKTKYATSLNWIETYYVEQINRKENMFIPKMLKNFFLSLKLFIVNKPDIVISFGALATIPICIIAKLFGKKIIFIESFAKISDPTLTGKFIYKFADQFYVQWETMLKYYPHAIFKGGIY